MAPWLRYRTILKIQHNMPHTVAEYYNTFRISNCIFPFRSMLHPQSINLFFKAILLILKIKSTTPKYKNNKFKVVLFQS